MSALHLPQPNPTGWYLVESNSAGVKTVPLGFCDPLGVFRDLSWNNIH